MFCLTMKIICLLLIFILTIINAFFYLIPGWKLSQIMKIFLIEGNAWKPLTYQQCKNVEKCYKDRLNECFEKMFKQEHSKHDRSYSTQQSLLLHIELGGHITKTLLSPGS